MFITLKWTPRPYLPRTPFPLPAPPGAPVPHSHTHVHARGLAGSVAGAAGAEAPLRRELGHRAPVHLHGGVLSLCCAQQLTVAPHAAASGHALPGPPPQHRPPARCSCPHALTCFLQTPEVTVSSPPAPPARASPWRWSVQAGHRDGHGAGAARLLAVVFPTSEQPRPAWPSSSGLLLAVPPP